MEVGSGPRTTGLECYGACVAGLKIGYHQSSHFYCHTGSPQEWVVYFYLQGWLGRHFNYMEPVVSGWKSVINIPVQNIVAGKVF